jgi:predicted RNA-binding Zn-ribbon protein involved in translation (DUF1610 family)
VLAFVALAAALIVGFMIASGVRLPEYHPTPYLPKVYTCSACGWNGTHDDMNYSEQVVPRMVYIPSGDDGMWTIEYDTFPHWYCPVCGTEIW